MGCATTEVAPVDSKLTGSWALDRAASDDAAAKVTVAINTTEDKLRRLRQHYGLDSGPGGPGARGAPPGGGGDDEGNFDVPTDPYGGPGRLGPDFRELRARLMQSLQPPNTLKINVSSEVVRITPDNIPPRDYRTDEEFSRFDEYGTSKIDSDWSGTAFVLRARYTSNASRTERYEAQKDGASLTLTCVLNDPTIGRVSVRSVYRRQ